MSKKFVHTSQKYPDPVRFLPPYPFDYRYLNWLLRNYRSPRDKIGRMIRKGEIIHIRKGLYILAPDFGGTVNRKVLANLIYGPSYISLEYALQYWGLIPERVETVTSITIKRNNYFRTPLGFFSYQYLHKSKFYQGVQRIKCRFSGAFGEKDQETGFFIASPEKALCDKIAAVKELNKPADISDYLTSDLRIEPDRLNLNLNLLDKICSSYRKKPVSILLKWYRSNRAE